MGATISTASFNWADVAFWALEAIIALILVQLPVPAASESITDYNVTAKDAIQDGDNKSLTAESDSEAQREALIIRLFGPPVKRIKSIPFGNYWPDGEEYPSFVVNPYKRRNSLPNWKLEQPGTTRETVNYFNYQKKLARRKSEPGNWHNRPFSLKRQPVRPAPRESVPPAPAFSQPYTPRQEQPAAIQEPASHIIQATPTQFLPEYGREDPITFQDPFSPLPNEPRITYWSFADADVWQPISPAIVAMHRRKRVVRFYDSRYPPNLNILREDYHHTGECSCCPYPSEPRVIPEARLVVSPVQMEDGDLEIGADVGDDSKSCLSDSDTITAEDEAVVIAVRRRSRARKWIGRQVGKFARIMGRVRASEEELTQTTITA